MRIGILGSGEVAKALAAGFLDHGDDVMLGTRAPSKLVDWAANTANARTGNFAEAAAFGDLVVLAVKGGGALDALTLAGATNLRGKIVIDTTNPIADVPPDNGVLRFFTNLENSLMEQLQGAFPDSRFVKAFNSVGSSLMVNPDLDGGKPTMFICGNDAGAKHEVRTILEAFGWDSADMGKAESARAIEPLCILWCIPGFLSNDWVHAFKMLPSRE